MRRRELHNVTLVRSEIDGPEVRTALREALTHHQPADAAGGPRPRHNSRPAPAAPTWSSPRASSTTPRSPARPPRPRRSRAPSTEDAPGGAVAILDYEAHDDQALRDQQADLWLGFEPRELKRLAREAGLIDVTWQRLPAAWQGEGPDRHLAWQLLVGKRGTE